jgi:hypothetical protein
MRIRAFVASVALALGVPSVSMARDSAPPPPGPGASSTCQYCKCDVTILPGGASIVNCGCAGAEPFLGTGYRKCERVVSGAQTGCNLTDIGKCSAPGGGGPGVIT